MTQNKLIVSNWKMNLNISDSRKLINKLVKSTQKIKSHKNNYLPTIFTNSPSIKYDKKYPDYFRLPGLPL